MGKYIETFRQRMIEESNNLESNRELIKKIFNFYENKINQSHTKREFKNEADMYFRLFNELRKYLKNNDNVKRLFQMSNKLKSLNRIDDEFNSVLRTIIREKEELKKQLLNSNDADNNKSDVVKKEMSKKRPNMSKEDVREISDELDRLCDKYPENKQLEELQISWYEGDNKSSDYDFWYDKIKEIFKK